MVLQPAVTVATPGDRERVVDTIVAAFVADPAFRYFFPDEATFARDAGAFGGYLFDRRVRYGTVFLVDGGAAVSLWEPPTGTSVVVEPAVEGGADPVLDLAPPLLARLDQYEAAVHTSLPTEPHWYLGVLATHPSYAGRQWGRLAMEPGLARAAADGLPAYLETTNPANVELYGRSGFVVASHLVPDPPKLGIDVWVMRRPAPSG